jgi:hypothetical protein
MNAKTCLECGQTAVRLRRERCDACYMRLYRGGEVPEGSACGGCDERRRELLCLEPVAGADAAVCGNCALLLRRTRPRLASLAELRRRQTRERRAARAGSPGSPGSPAPTKRRASDRTLPRPAFDVSCD